MMLLKKTAENQRGISKGKMKLFSDVSIEGCGISICRSEYFTLTTLAK